MAIQSLKDRYLHPSDTPIAQRVPPIDQTACDLTADRDFFGLNIARRDDVGIYGPTPALANDDWTGSGGVPTASAAGEFTVTGAGSLTLTIPSSYEQRLTEIPLGTAPEGCPGGYWYRRADHYYPAWGDPEGAYCWLGWERLDIPVTAPSACTLTLTVTYHTYTFVDNHKSDSTRVTEFEWTPTEHTAVYTIPVAGGAETLHVTLVAPNGGDYPLFERVSSMVLSGFSNGNWVIGEPTLVVASPSQVILKTFEGWERSWYDEVNEEYVYQYRHGGGSIHADAAFQWYDADEDNYGHDNLSELTVRFFDYVVGAVSGLDLTTAYSLAAWASIITAVSEVFDASENTAVTDAKTVDDETPANTLTALYGFDVAYPDAESEVANENPLEQSVATDVGSVSIRCETWTIAAGIKYAIVTDKVVDGRAHGRTLSGTSLARTQTAITNLWRRPPTGGAAWTFVGSLDSDGFGHWTSPTLWEVYSYTGDPPDDVQRYLYTVAKTQPPDGSAANIGESYAREYVVETIVITAGGGVCVIEQIPHFVYVVYNDAGLKHIYNAPPDFWFAQHRSQAHYALPKTDTTEDDTSPSGYVDTNGRIRLYFIRGGAVLRGTSQNWGYSWGGSDPVATAITSADACFVWPSEDRTRQFSVRVQDGSFIFSYSHDHFDTIDGSSTITTGADAAQVSGYDQNGVVYGYCFKGGALYCFAMSQNGTWKNRGSV